MGTVAEASRSFLTPGGGVGGPGVIPGNGLDIFVVLGSIISRPAGPSSAWARNLSAPIISVRR